MILTVCAPNWTNQIVLYVSDNMLVTFWLTNLRSTNKLANFICGIVSLSMCRDVNQS